MANEQDNKALLTAALKAVKKFIDSRDDGDNNDDYIDEMGRKVLRMAKSQGINVEELLSE